MRQESFIPYEKEQRFQDHLSGKDNKDNQEYCVSLQYWDPKQRQCQGPLPVYNGVIVLMLGTVKPYHLLKSIQKFLQKVYSTR